MQIYLPIAEISVNIFLILGLGFAVGALSGIFGVGGGFLMTPILIFIGIPPAVAVGTQANQIVASSVSGVFAHWRRNNVDVKMGVVLLAGGLVGSALGVWLFAFLRSIGQIDLVIRLLYVIFLGIVGGLMFIESLRVFVRRRSKAQPKRSGPRHGWSRRLPFRMRFHRSKLYVSALVPLSVGLFVGVLGAIMGVGGGFIMVPAMIYLIGMPTSVVIGTSLFQIIFVAANIAFLQAYANQTVDIVLALLLIVGGVIGAQIGARIGARLRGEQIRILLAALVLAVCFKLAFDLSTPPEDIYNMAPLS